MTDKDIEWFDSGIEPKAASNPDYPRGIDIDISDGKRPSCFVALPYPAKRIGRYLIKCRTCGLSGIVTTAGRPDDPRSVKLACKRLMQ